MLRQYTSQLNTLFKRLLVVYLAYLLCRICFYWFNRHNFHDLSFGEFASILFYALRFDTFSIIATNGLFIFLSALPINAINFNWYQKILVWIYMLFNSIAIIANLIDIVYFPYIKKRSTADIFKQAGGQTDLGKLLPQYIKDFWYLLVTLAIILFVVYKIYKRIRVKEVKYSYNLKSASAHFLYFVVFCGLMILGVRGGVQRIPIDVVDAGKYAQQQNINLLLNSPFTIIKSMEKDELKEIHFTYGTQKIEEIFSPINHFKSDTLRKQNVVVLILESFSKEYTGLGNRKSYTPFFDSLSKHTLCFTNAFSNGNKSIEGVPAILSSIPSLMENPFINSAYSGNQYNSLGNLLKAEGYSTAFFHGGINGTMNFDGYAAQAGYDAYFGRNEYGNDDDFDGFWGIFDEPFFMYSIKKMSELPEPFHSAIFTISSHHPYIIPTKYKNKFPKGDLEIHESIGYADYALRMFFKQASQQKWYSNTLFVLCADHGSITKDHFYYNDVGHFSIPVLFFKPDNSLIGNYPFVFQHTDILPSVLKQIGYNKPFFSFGKPYTDSVNRYINYYANGVNFMANDSLAFYFTDYKLSAVYNYKKDSVLTNNLLNAGNHQKHTMYFQAFIETYHKSIINNECRVK